MAKQFFIPDSPYLPRDLAGQQQKTQLYLQSLLPSVADESLTDKTVYSFSYVDSNNDEIVYTVGKEHPFKSAKVLLVCKAAEVFYVFSDERGLKPERLDFSGHSIADLQFFDLF
ncbi:hypothetical protein [Sphingobacterium griseoflavum]|uniref:Uncharacterized protein n=1 Tax=Sphingobacterium griseoflavum TaxID=1474952 RepID=A0ABQ3I283_9SPHI|nr:hypothetical protein [Sphingobacterium griseoflavum]GHE49257.1 hypothetical protein GCM10017764_35380 [Sphingobacterium griseoflavum]